MTTPSVVFNVWVEIEHFDTVTSDSRTLDAPGASLASFATYEEAWDYAERVTRLAEGIITQEGESHV